MGRIIACVSLVICFVGIAYSILLLKASKDTLKAMGAEIKIATGDMKECTVRAVQELSKEKAHTTTVTNKMIVPMPNSFVTNVEKVCPNCKKTISAESVFCTQCGFKVNEVEAKTCPSCGSAVESDMVFCTQCGHKISEIQVNEGE